MKSLEELKSRKLELITELSKLETNDQQQQELKKYFALGQVGHAGKNAKKLIRKQKANMEKVVQKAVEFTILFDELKLINRQIQMHESGHFEAVQQKANALQEQIEKMTAGGHVLHGWLRQVGKVVKVNEKSFRVNVNGELKTWKKSEITKAVLPKEDTK